MGDEPKLLRDFLLGFMRIHVLHHAAEAPIYGLWMRDELASHGYDLSVGTLYPMLHQMESQGYLTSEQRLVGGRVRRYYTATDEGRWLLAQLRPKVRELVDEVASPAADLQTTETAETAETANGGGRDERS